jgi:hypothetical protein
LIHETLSNSEKAIEVILRQVHGPFFIPSPIVPKTRHGQLTGEAGPETRILKSSDVQNIAVNVDAEPRKVFDITYHNPCVTVVEEVPA